MKRLFPATAFLIMTGLMLAPTAFAQEYTENWEVSSFHSDITLNKNGIVDIAENIVANFTNEAHRGIARVIPYKYTDGYDARIDFKSATDENGIPWALNVYRSGGYLNIEMTNHEDEYRNDINTFLVNYTAQNVIGFFDDHDELYWNVNGTEWVVPVSNVTAEIHLPVAIKPEDIMLDCFTGIYGAEEKNCTISAKNEKTVVATATRNLSPYENLTIVIGLPKGTFTPPSFLTKLWWFIKDNWGILLGPLTIIIMLYLWHTRGRDEKTARDTVIPHYKPPKGLLPTETGTIIDEKIDPRDITATIIDFAVRGYIRINEIEKKKFLGTEKDYELELIKPYITTKEFETMVLEGLFTQNAIGEKITLSALKNKFYTAIPKIKKNVMNTLIKDGFFPHNPSTVRGIYVGIGVAIIFLSFNFIVAFSISLFIGMLISGAAIAGIGYFLPRKTQKGTETYYVLRGLYEYINTAERDRMKFQEEKNILFEKLLPYAISFGLIKKWAKAFDGILTEPPGWYIPVHPYALTRPFRMAAFADQLSTISTKMTTTLMSRPGSRGGGAWSGGSGFGGGFSGGGFGGGGGRGL
ncbi:MAG: DUF2207 domain-containing protein [Candidatus Peregrinibacteria bacterium]